VICGLSEIGPRDKVVHFRYVLFLECAETSGLVRTSAILLESEHCYPISGYPETPDDLGQSKKNLRGTNHKTMNNQYRIKIGGK